MFWQEEGWIIKVVKFNGTVYMMQVFQYIEREMGMSEILNRKNKWLFLWSEIYTPVGNIKRWLYTGWYRGAESEKDAATGIGEGSEVHSLGVQVWTVHECSGNSSWSRNTSLNSSWVFRCRWNNNLYGLIIRGVYNFCCSQ